MQRLSEFQKDWIYLLLFFSLLVLSYYRPTSSGVKTRRDLEPLLKQELKANKPLWTAYKNMIFWKLPQQIQLDSIAVNTACKSERPEKYCTLSFRAMYNFQEEWSSLMYFEWELRYDYHPDLDQNHLNRELYITEEAELLNHFHLLEKNATFLRFLQRKPIEVVYDHDEG